MSYHISNLGSYGAGIPTDLDGYVHLTAEDWLRAPMDTAGGPMDEDQAEELASEARRLTEEAQAALAVWQQS